MSASASLQDLATASAENNAYANELVMYCYVMLTSFCILLMQAGFALLEAGGCRSKNAKSILYKNGIDLSVGILVWWFWGYGFATASSENESLVNFGGSAALSFLISVCFSTTSSTIVSGAVAERINFWVYMTSTISIAGCSYPLMMQWIWTDRQAGVPGSGWLLEKGVIDFAGSGVVHLLGASAAFVTAVKIGPRIGRFIVDGEGNTNVNAILPYDPVLQTIGTWILIFGWLSFNGASSGAADLDALHTSARVVVMTLIAMAAAGLSCTLCQFPTGQLSLSSLNNCLLGGLVSITAGCASVSGVGAFFTGMIGGGIGLYGHHIPLYFMVDDPLDTFTVHGLNGAWGLVAVGIFAKEQFVTEGSDYGILYGGTGKLLGWQIVAAVLIIFIASVVAFCSLSIMQLFGRYVLGVEDNFLRISQTEEIEGIDAFEFHGYVYPEQKRIFDRYDGFIQDHEDDFLTPTPNPESANIGVYSDVGNTSGFGVDGDQIEMVEATDSSV